MDGREPRIQRAAVGPELHRLDLGLCRLESAVRDFHHHHRRLGLGRWFCRSIEGTRREIVFKGSGLDILWRGIVAAILCSLIIPIPWVYRWIMNWFASETVLAPRGSQAAM